MDESFMTGTIAAGRRIVDWPQSERRFEQVFPATQTAAHGAEGRTMAVEARYRMILNSILNSDATLRHQGQVATAIAFEGK
jgi:hypothetical protein